MLRFIAILLVTVLLISVLRAIIGTVVRGFSELISGGTSTTASPSRRPDVPVAGELKKDPVCGTFIPAATAMKKTVRGETVYFCSQECRDKFTT
jgi:YHS domain-containing protein